MPQASRSTSGSQRHFLKIRGGESMPQEMRDHTVRNTHVIGPSDALLSEWQQAGLPAPDLSVVRHYRLQRIRADLRHSGCDAMLLYDPVNIRYATDTTNMSLWTMYNAVRYAFIPTEGPLTLFEYSDAEFLSAYSDVVDDIRPAISMHPFFAGHQVVAVAKIWAAENVDVLREHTTGSRLAVDILALDGIRAMEHLGIELVIGHAFLEQVRLIKHEQERVAIRRAVHVYQSHIDDVCAFFTPCVTEIDV